MSVPASKTGGCLGFAMLAVVAQFAVCISIWIATLMFRPMLDSVFEAMIYAYWPPMVLVTRIIWASGDSAEFSGPILGILVGIFGYGAVVGTIISFFKRKRLKRFP
jgi:hypothetical protein